MIKIDCERKCDRICEAAAMSTWWVGERERVDCEASRAADISRRNPTQILPSWSRIFGKDRWLGCSPIHAKWCPCRAMFASGGKAWTWRCRNDPNQDELRGRKCRPRCDKRRALERHSRWSASCIARQLWSQDNLNCHSCQCQTRMFFEVNCWQLECAEVLRNKSRW